jgi:heat shock protein HslJ
MNKFLLIALFGTIILSLWWYQDIFRSGSTSIQDETIEGINQEETIAQLSATRWIWIKTIMNDGTVIEPRKTNSFTLSYTSEGILQGTTDCNTFSGDYTVDGTRISYSPLAMTMMYCEDSQEQEFQSMITEAQSIFFDSDDNLVLLLPYDSGSIIFAPEFN